MIEIFNDVPIRKSSIIYNSVFEQIKKLYAVNPEQAGELAISAIELALTGQISSDDMIIELMLEPTKIITEDNHDKYDQKCENTRQKKITEQKLDQIAEMMQKGYKQREIADRLHLTQQMVSYRWGVIKTSYPELLEGSDQREAATLQNVYKNTKLTKDTKNESFVPISTKEEFVKIGEICKNDVEEEWKF